MTGVSGRGRGNSTLAGISGAVLGHSALELSGFECGRRGFAEAGTFGSDLGDSEPPGTSRCRGDSAAAGTSEHGNRATWDL